MFCTSCSDENPFVIITCEKCRAHFKLYKSWKIHPRAQTVLSPGKKTEENYTITRIINNSKTCNRRFFKKFFIEINVFNDTKYEIPNILSLQKLLVNAVLENKLDC